MPMQKLPAPQSSHQQGVVIVEALIAILIFSVGVLGIVGMQANMVKNTSESKYRADAGYIAQQQLGQLWADPDPVSLNAILPDGGTINPVISDLLPSGALSITRAGNQFTATVTWQQPGESQHTFTTTATIAGG